MGTHQPDPQEPANPKSVETSGRPNTKDMPEGDRAGKSPRSARHIVVGILLLGVAVFCLWQGWKIVNEPTTVSTALPEAPAPILMTAEDPSTSREELTKLFEAHLAPLISHANQKNIEAKERALQEIRDAFQTYRTGIPDFTEDLTGMGTRFGIVSNWSQDAWDAWWNENENANRVGEYVHEKFKAHVFSEQDLQDMMIQTVTKFSDDLKANRNNLLLEYKPILSSSSMPVEVAMSDRAFEKFAQEWQEHFTELTGKLGEESIAALILSLIAGEAATFGGQQLAVGAVQVAPSVVAAISGPLMTSVMAPIAAHFAATGVTAGGATAGFAIVGGGGGSAVGPVGTTVGLVVGLIAGSVADFWLSARFEKKTAEDISKILTALEHQIIMGVPGEKDQPGGMNGIFDEANREMEHLMRQATLEALWGVQQ